MTGYSGQAKLFLALVALKVTSERYDQVSPSPPTVQRFSIRSER